MRSVFVMQVGLPQRITPTSRSGTSRRTLLATLPPLTIETVTCAPRSARRSVSLLRSSRPSTRMMSLRPNRPLGTFMPTVTGPSRGRPRRPSACVAVPTGRWSTTVPLWRRKSLGLGTRGLRDDAGPGKDVREDQREERLAHGDAVPRLLEVERAGQGVHVGVHLGHARERMEDLQVRAEALGGRAVEAVGVLDLLVVRRVGEALLLDAGHVEDVEVARLVEGLDLAAEAPALGEDVAQLLRQAEHRGADEGQLALEVEQRLREAVDGPAVAQVAQEPHAQAVEPAGRL